MDDALVIAGSGSAPGSSSAPASTRAHEVMQRVPRGLRRGDGHGRRAAASTSTRKGEASLLHWIDTARGMTLLPNTAGCYTADDAVRTCRLAASWG